MRGTRPDDRSGWRAARFAAVALALRARGTRARCGKRAGDDRARGPQGLSYQPVAAPRGLASPFSSPKPGRKRSSGTPLEYHGGPVMTSNTNYPLYWDPAGAGEYPAGYQSGINKWFEDLAA